MVDWDQVSSRVGLEANLQRDREIAVGALGPRVRDYSVRMASRSTVVVHSKCASSQNAKTSETTSDLPTTKWSYQHSSYERAGSAMTARDPIPAGHALLKAGRAAARERHRTQLPVATF